MTALRFYGIAALDAGLSGALVPHTELVTLRDIGAIVAPSAFLSAEPSEQDIERYRGVIEGVFAKHAIVPAQPGTVFRSRETLLKWLELHYFTLIEALNFVADRVAIRVHVSPAPPEESAVEMLDEPPPSTSAPATPETDPVAQSAEVFRSLRRSAVALMTVKPGEGDSHQASASFLVDRERFAAFREAVQTESQRLPKLAISWTGPWPPYDFVRMELGG